VPRVTFASAVGYIRYPRVMASDRDANRPIVGPSLENSRGICLLDCFDSIDMNVPVFTKVVTAAVHSSHGQPDSTPTHQQHPSTLTPPTPASTSISTEIPPVMLCLPRGNVMTSSLAPLFETVGIPSLYLSLSVTTVLYTLGKSNGLVIEGGASGWRVLSVAEGGRAVSRVEMNETGGEAVRTAWTSLAAVGGLAFPEGGDYRRPHRVSSVRRPSTATPRLATPSPSLSLAGRPTTGPSGIGLRGDALAVALSSCSRRPALPGLLATRDLVSATQRVAPTPWTPDCLSPSGGPTPAHYASTPDVTYRLPDGQALHLSPFHQTAAAEILFQPHLFGSSDRPVTELVSTALDNLPGELKRNLLANVVVAGGASCYSGFGERLLHELSANEALVPPGGVSLRISAPPSRATAAWTGASILASLSSYKGHWLTRQEYDEVGVNAFRRFLPCQPNL